MAEASASEVTIGVPVEVWVEHLRPNRAGWPDTGAPILAVKAMVDGLVDAGALPNDRPETVRWLHFAPPIVTGHHGLRLTLTEARIGA
jgi:hypothetical protein